MARLGYQHYGAHGGATPTSGTGTSSTGVGTSPPSSNPRSSSRRTAHSSGWCA